MQNQELSQKFHEMPSIPKTDCFNSVFADKSLSKPIDKTATLI